ncbi:MAG TPA: glycosyltransferase family A protein [Stellaceae bacterium]|jgi:chlorobactene glucosyltransferase|nr:glycosyltransferase family A protein [Stellaceae bacterium]
MAALVAGAIWAGLVAYLLSRVMRQGRAFAAATLPDCGSCDIAGGLAIVVPMRNEIDNFDACLESLLAQRGLPDDWRIVVVDDNSTDGTAERLERLAAAEPRLHSMRAGALPPGWTGKSHACWLGATACRSGWLCFIDADVQSAPTLIASAVAAAARSEVDMLSLSPFQELGSFWERLIVPAGLLAIAGAMDLRRVGDPAARDVAANGQFLLFRRSAYEAAGGHRAVRGEICEDKALARLVKSQGRRFRLMAAERLARTRMYRDLGSLWDGLGKNAVEILGSSAASVAAATAAATVAWTAVALPVWSGIGIVEAPSAPERLGFALILLASLALCGAHLGTLRHCRIPFRYAGLLLVAYTAVAVLAWFSLGLRWTGRVRWKGRTYRTEALSRRP